MSFKRKISYRYEITTQPKNNSLDYLINQICEKIINILFLLSFKNGNKDPMYVCQCIRDFIFEDYYKLL